MSHPGTEETRLDEGELWLLVSVSCLGLGGFLLVFVLLVFFSPSSRRVSFPSNDDLGTPPTRRPHSWKKRQLLSCQREEGAGLCHHPFFTVVRTGPRRISWHITSLKSLA